MAERSMALGLEMEVYIGGVFSVKLILFYRDMVKSSGVVRLVNSAFEIRNESRMFFSKP